MAHDIDEDQETGNPAEKRETVVENGRASREPFEREPAEEDYDSVRDLLEDIKDGIEDVEEGRTMSDGDVKDALGEE